MKTKLNTLVLLVLALAFSSCLKKDLPELPLYDANEITAVNIEHRYESSTLNMWGQPVVSYKKMNTSQTIDKANSVINVTVAVPAASGDFTVAEKAKVAQNKLWLYLNISTAATISPTGGTPALGDPTDCTKPLKYIVKAANGATRVWTVNITSFTN